MVIAGLELLEPGDDHEPSQVRQVVNSLTLLETVFGAGHLDLYHVTQGWTTATIWDVEIGPK